MLHPDTASMLQESLREYLFVARYCVRHRKAFCWGPGQQNGRLGYPAAVMLFCIADSIGSYHRELGGFSVLVDGNAETIKSTGFQHLYVLNSDYYGQDLAKADIERLYSNFRSLLLHNAALAPDYHLVSRPKDPDAFPLLGGNLSVNIDGFLSISERAVALFLEQAPTIVPTSKQAAVIAKKV